MTITTNELAFDVLASKNEFDETRDYTDIFTYILTEAPLTHMSKERRDMVYRAYVKQEPVSQIAKSYNVAPSRVEDNLFKARMDMENDGEIIKLLMDGPNSDKEVDETYPYQCLGMTPRRNNSLRIGLGQIAGSIHYSPTIINLTKVSRRKLLSLNGLGPTVVNDVDERLKKMGLHLAK